MMIIIGIITIIGIVTIIGILMITSIIISTRAEILSADLNGPDGTHAINKGEIL